MKTFDKITVFFSKAVGWLTFVGYATALVVLFEQIVARYVFNYGILWTDEFARYTMVWLVMLCSATLVRDKQHIRLTLLDSFFPKKALRWGELFIQLVILLFSVVVFRYSLVNLSLSQRAVSTNMRIPMTCIYLTFPVSTALMAFNAVFNALSLLLNRVETDIDKEEMVE